MNNSHKLFPDYLQSMMVMQEGFLKIMQNPKSYSTMQDLILSTFNDVSEGMKKTVIDRRFSHELWQNHSFFSLLKDKYLEYCEQCNLLVESLPVENEQLKKQFQFFMTQYLNAISPSNNPFLNPVILEKSFQTQGQNFINGYMNYLGDLNKFNGFPNISMTNDDAFGVGINLATTIGKVVFENSLMQLICYEPLTPKVYGNPLLIVPPWINKYYILDLSEKNSFIRWLLNQGIQVFMISWLNPSARDSYFGFDDYMNLGPMASFDFIQNSLGHNQINALGFCIGGTLLSTTAAYRAAKQLTPFHSLTYLATLMDFSEPGDIGIFINDEWLDLIDKKMQEDGILDGRIFNLTFSLLRSNELYWSFFVNNYLLGEKPADFDILYWNGDCTNLPYAMHHFYLRNMYQQNKLIKKELNLADVTIDLTKIASPSFFLSTELDHIAPWKTTYQGALAHQKAEFVLAGSGHIAGVINPPEKKKYGFKVNKQLPDEAQDWLNHAVSHEGSWWPYFGEWLKNRAGTLVDSKYKSLPLIEAAPGKYVLEGLFGKSKDVARVMKDEEKAASKNHTQSQHAEKDSVPEEHKPTEKNVTHQKKNTKKNQKKQSQ